MAKFPTFEEMAKNIAEKALDDFLYNGKSIREWMRIIASEDCISRKAVLALAKEECDTAIIPYRKFVKDVNALSPVTPAQTWIPVSERLPEEYGEYLITWTTSQSKRPFIAICECEISNIYNHDMNRFDVEWLLEDYIKAYSDVEVIAWMPLPELYKAEREEEEG